jgi:curved DNA-binding protein CbpA
MSLINPYDLLGFDSKNPNIEMKELKSQYFTLSLICHPDKGGSVEDMIILKNAYQYIKEQIEGKDAKSKDVKEVEEEFKNFMKNQSNIPPPFSQVYEEAHLWLQDFNQKFVESKTNKNLKNNDENPVKDDADEDGIEYADMSYNILEDGYGEMMDVNIYYENDLEKLKEQRNIEIVDKIVPKFKEEIVVYTEPVSFNYSSASVFNINKTKVDDFSIGEISDYKKAFTSAKFDKIDSEKVGDNNTDVLNNFEKLMADRNMLDSNLFDLSKAKVDRETEIQLKFEELLSERKIKK